MPVGFVVVLLLLGVICSVSTWPHTRAPTRRLVQNDAGGDPAATVVIAGSRTGSPHQGHPGNHGAGHGGADFGDSGGGTAAIECSCDASG